MQIGSLDEPTTIRADATVRDTWFPVPNREENFGTAAVLANMVGHRGAGPGVTVWTSPIWSALATFAPFANDGKRHANVTALSRLRATLQRLERNRARYVNGEVGLDRVLPRSVVVTFIEDLAHKPVDAHDAYLRLHLLCTRKE